MLVMMSSTNNFDEKNYKKILDACMNSGRTQLGQLTGSSGQHEAMWERATDTLIKNIKELNDAPGKIAALEVKSAKAQSEFERQRIALDIEKVKNNADIAKTDVRQQLEIIASFSNSEFTHNVSAIIEPVKLHLGDSNTLKSNLDAIHMKGASVYNQKRNDLAENQKNASDDILKVPAMLIELKRIQREVEIISADSSNAQNMMEAQRLCSQARTLVKQIDDIGKSAQENLVKPYKDGGEMPEQYSKRLAYLEKAASIVKNLENQIKHDTTPGNITSLDEAQRVMLHAIKSSKWHQECSNFNKNRRDQDKDTAFYKKTYNQMERVEAFFKTHEHLRKQCNLHLTEQFKSTFTEVGMKASPVPKATPMLQSTCIIYEDIKNKKITVEDWKKLDNVEKCVIRDAIIAEFKSPSMNINPAERGKNKEIFENFLRVMSEAKVQEKISKIENLPSPPRDPPKFR